MRPELPMQWRSVFYPPANYPYFEKLPDFDSSQRVGGLNLLKAAWMADAAMLAYAKSGPATIPSGEFEKIMRTAQLGFTLLGDWSGGPTGTQAFFAVHQRFAVLSFRGTEKEDWKDLASDLSSWPVAEDFTRHGNGLAAKTMHQLLSARAVFDPRIPAVHRGFQAALNEVWPATSELLRAYRRDHSNSEIFFTGHSLGAALATIAIARFDGGGASLYTFGSPRVGNSAFLDKVRANAGSGIYRFVDHNDLVTRIPPAIMRYTHDPATLYQIDPGGEIHDRTHDPAARQVNNEKELDEDLACLSELKFPIDLDSQPPSDLYDHSPGQYCNRLWNRLVISRLGASPA